MIKKFILPINFLFLVFLLATTGCSDSSILGQNDSKSSTDNRALSAGYPSDFNAPADDVHGGSVRGFGGNKSANKAQHQSVAAGSTLLPIIVLHGNGGSSTSDEWGPEETIGWLKAAGYPDELIWAPSYLGYDGTASNHGMDYADYPNVVSNNALDIERYVDAVLEYTGSNKVNIVGHSSGGSLALAYALGYKNSYGSKVKGSAMGGSVTCYPASSHSFSLNNLSKIGAIVTLAADHYGFTSPMQATCNFNANGEFMKQKLTYWEANYTAVLDKIKIFTVVADGDWVDGGYSTQMGNSSFPAPDGNTSALTHAEIKIYPMPSSIPSKYTSTSSTNDIAWHKYAFNHQESFNYWVSVLPGKDVSVSFDPVDGSELPKDNAVVTITVDADADSAYYSINDGPQISFAAPSTTVTLTCDATILVGVTKGAISTTESASYTIDDGRATITIDPEGGAVVEGTTVNISADRGTTSLEVTLGDAATQTISGDTATVTITEAATLTVVAVNSEGRKTKTVDFTLKPNCSDASGTVSAHVDAGRAYAKGEETCWFGIWCFTTNTYFAKGSDENLGTSGYTNVTLKTEDDGATWQKGVCEGGGDGDGDGDGDCNSCSSYSCCVEFGCSGYSYVEGGMKCYTMSGYTMVPCSCWQ